VTRKGINCLPVAKNTGVKTHEEKKLYNPIQTGRHSKIWDCCFCTALV
jgi:hypothetical protein